MCICLHCRKNTQFARFMSKIQANEHMYVVSRGKMKRNARRKIIEYIRKAINVADANEQLSIISSHRLASIENIPRLIEYKRLEISTQETDWILNQTKHVELGGLY